MCVQKSSPGSLNIEIGVPLADEFVDQVTNFLIIGIFEVTIDFCVAFLIWN